MFFSAHLPMVGRAVSAALIIWVMTSAPIFSAGPVKASNMDLNCWTALAAPSTAERATGLKLLSAWANCFWARTASELFFP